MNSTKFQIIFVILVIGIGLALFSYQQRDIKAVILGGKTFSVEVAKTEMERERGLSLHVPLSDNQGMLFIFQKEDLYGFWMKDMTFSLDIIWIDENLKIVDIKKDLSPDTYPKSFSPQAKSLYVLEIPAGQSEALGIAIGDSVKFVKN